jgi:hypothetical protein
MTTPAVCLRCDWQGETAADACPDCGAPLFRGSAARVETKGQPSHPDSATFEEGSTSEALEPEPDPVRRSRPGLILGMLGLLVMFAAFVSFGALSSGPAAPPSPSWHPSGSLVFAAVGSSGGLRLWRWDLSSRTATRGPLVPGAVRLVSAESVAPGAVGIVSTATDGAQRASLLRIFGLSERPEPVIRGDLVSWPPGGNVVVASAPAGGPGCRGSTIASLNLATGLRTRDLRVCGSVTALGRAGVSTFFTVRRAGAARIDYVGFRRAHVVLRGYALRSASPATDLIVTPAHGSPPGAALFWEGNRPRPVPYGSGGDPLVAAEVLAWSPDSSSALIEGFLGDRSGVWLVQAGAGTDSGPRAPAPVLEGPTRAWAAYDRDGTAYVVADGRFFVFREGELSPISPPSGAPAPSGPLAWLR